MNFNKFASAWNSQTERNLKSSQALAEHRTPKTEDYVLGMVLQPNCFSSNSSASCQQPATLAAHRAALQVVMLGVRPARIISLAVQMAETQGAGNCLRVGFNKMRCDHPKGVHVLSQMIRCVVHPDIF